MLKRLGRLLRFVNVIQIALIRVYQKSVSPVLMARCIYRPSCSNYAIDALTKYNFVKADMMIVWRILRCNPWARGGVDPA